MTELAYNGKPCEGLLKETKPCNVGKCEEPVGTLLRRSGL